MAAAAVFIGSSCVLPTFLFLHHSSGLQVADHPGRLMDVWSDTERNKGVIRL
jgi:hypothetical protein